MKSKPNLSLVRSRDLQQNIALLASVESSDAPFVSCYLDLSQGDSGHRRFLEQRAESLRQTLHGAARADFEHALALIESALDADLHPRAQGMALFARGPRGGRFFLAMQFAVPVQNSLSVYPAPDIYSLLALKHSYDRYVLVLTRPDWLQVIEVSLGAATVRAWAVNRGSRASDNGLDRQRSAAAGPNSAQAWVARQAPMVQRLLQTGGRSHWILAGDPELAEQLSSQLPLAVRARLVDLLPIPASWTQQQLVAAALRRFIAFRESEAQYTAASVVRGVRYRGLAVAGALASLEALREGRADTLIMSRDYHPESGWVCTRCGEGCIGKRRPAYCPACSGGVQALYVRTELLRLAGRQDVAFELVNSDQLRYLGGVGCLLRAPAESRGQPGPRAFNSLDLVA